MAETIPKMVFSRVKRLGGKTVLQVKRGFGYSDISWTTLGERITHTALGLSDLGVTSGDRVAILSENRPEWAIADLAILSLGAVTVPVYVSLTSSEIEYILKDSGAKVLFVSTPEMMTKVFPLQGSLGLKLILFDAPYQVSGPRIWWLGELEGLGKTSGAQTSEDWHTQLDKGQANGLCSIIYTSGTTGNPKGVMLSHNNFLSNCRSVENAVPISENDVLLSFLPLSHVFERMAGYYYVLFVGGVIAYAEEMDRVPENLREVRPTVITAVPRFFEKIHERILETIDQASPLKQKIFHWAISVGQKRLNCRLKSRGMGLSLSLQYFLAHHLVLSQLQEKLGGRLRFAISGGAPLRKELAEFFYAAGLLILEGYGLTETSPVITCNRPNQFRFGSVGLPVEDVEIRIAEDGEILSRGPHIMQGYFHNPEATSKVIDSDGWFHTGDVGHIDDGGFLIITDRKKDLIKTSGGKMCAPQNLEASLKKDPLIEDCVVIGDRRKYLSALIVPNIQGCIQYAQRERLSYENTAALVQLREIIELVWISVQEVNAGLASFEQLKKITLLPEPFTLDSGTLTPTFKVKRQVIAQKYAQEIEAMYSD